MHLKRQAWQPDCKVLQGQGLEAGELATGADQRERKHRGQGVEGPPHLQGGEGGMLEV